MSAIEIQVGTVLVTGTEQLVATLLAWHPKVDVYVDPNGQRQLDGSLWRIYAVSDGVEALLAEGVFNSGAFGDPTIGVRVLGGVTGSGQTIELRALSPRAPLPPAPVTAAIVGWDPGVQQSPAQVQANATVFLTGVFADIVALGGWQPRIDVLVDPRGQPRAKGSEWLLCALIAGMTAPCAIAKGSLPDGVTPQVVIVGAMGGASDWLVRARSRLDATGKVVASVSGYTPGGAPGGGGGGVSMSLAGVPLAGNPQTALDVEGPSAMFGLQAGVPTLTLPVVGGVNVATQPTSTGNRSIVGGDGAGDNNFADVVALGTSADPGGDQDTLVGPFTSGSGQSTAVGPGAFDNGGLGTAVGPNAGVEGPQGTAVGNNSRAGAQAAAVGDGAFAGPLFSAALAPEAEVETLGEVARENTNLSAARIAGQASGWMMTGETPGAAPTETADLVMADGTTAFFDIVPTSRSPQVALLIIEAVAYNTASSGLGHAFVHYHLLDFSAQAGGAPVSDPPEIDFVAEDIPFPPGTPVTPPLFRSFDWSQGAPDGWVLNDPVFIADVGGRFRYGLSFTTGAAPANARIAANLRLVKLSIF